jgi:putative oxidoreductase
MNTPSSYVPAFGRLLIAVLFIFSGLGKLAAPAMTQSYIASAGLLAPVLDYVLAIMVELCGGVLLVVGFQTRIVALVMAIFTVAAAALFHRNFADQNQMIHFLKNTSIVGGLIRAFAFGPGAFSFDEQRTAPVAAQ